MHKVMHACMLFILGLQILTINSTINR